MSNQYITPECLKCGQRHAYWPCPTTRVEKSKTVIRQLECEEEEKVLADALRYITYDEEYICAAIGVEEEELAHMILSTLSHAGYKIVEGTCT